MDDATFTFGDPFRGEDARLAVRYMVRALTTTTVGDMMYIGQLYRSRIRQRTLAGIDVNGASLTPYSTKGPYYFYPNREVGTAGHARRKPPGRPARLPPRDAMPPPGAKERARLSASAITVAMRRRNRRTASAT
jgi:hypothetical protein